MCIGKKYCSELSMDPAEWDRHSLLPPPAWLDEQIRLFAETVKELVAGNTVACLDRIAGIRNLEITEWFVEHGQMTGLHRKKS